MINVVLVKEVQSIYYFATDTSKYIVTRNVCLDDTLQLLSITCICDGPQVTLLTKLSYQIYFVHFWVINHIIQTKDIGFVAGVKPMSGEESVDSESSEMNILEA